jgi:protocatechuate 3,4-dioxygenase beta subunit
VKHSIHPQPWRRSCAFFTTLLTIVFACMAGGPSLHAQQAPLRKIGELDLAIRGLVATTEATQTLPKATASGVRVSIRAGGQDLTTTAEVQRFIGGPFAVAGELSGPGLPQTQALRSETSDKSASADPFLLPIPALPTAGDYTLANLRVVRVVKHADDTFSDRIALDVAPSTVALKVLDQILITSVTTRPLTLEEIKARGIVLTSDDYKGFEFTIGMKLESKPVTISFPAIFDRQNIPVPQALVPPTVSRENVPVPQFVPVLLQAERQDGLPGAGPPLTFDGGPEITIPSVLVIPGNVGYLDQFFSAQLFVANGAPLGTPLTVHDITSKITLPRPADDNPDHAPLKLANTETGVHDTLPVRAVGVDGLPGTADDVDVLGPGAQGQAEFLVQGKQEGYYHLDFDIRAQLDGLPIGPVTISGKASGAVLVRNPYYDMTFTLPSVVRADEPFTLYATITNIGQGIGNDITVAIDAAALVHVRVDGDLTQHIATLMPGDATTVEFKMIPETTGQVVANYLKFDGVGGSGRMRFGVGVGERGVPLSPDTLVLPAVTEKLPVGVIKAAMRVLGQAYSAANAPAGTLPAGVIRPGKDIVTQKALALAEAGLRITLGQEPKDALRDLGSDFYLGLPKSAASTNAGALPTSRFDAGWDQILRQTDAGYAFARALGKELVNAVTSAGGPLGFERALAQVQASGADFTSFGVDAATVDVALSNAAGATTVAGRGTARPGAAIPGVGMIPLGTTDTAPVLGLITSLTGSPYTLTLSGRGAGATSVSVTLPRGDGTFLRGTVSGIPVTPTWRGRVTLNLVQPDQLTLDQDLDGDGTFEQRIALTTETIQAQGPQLVSATVVGPEILDAAAPWGQHAVLVFDRMVDATSAATTSHYQIPSNSVVGARAVMSQRLVMVSLEQPEGPWVPTTLTATGVNDGRGVPGSSPPVTLGSLLKDAGAIVTGHVFNADGTPFAGGRVVYEQYPDFKECQATYGDVALSRIVLDAAGAYQLRYVRRDRCGHAFTIATTDPQSGALVSVSRNVRSVELLPTPERLVVDLAIFGHGNVTGIVRDLQGRPVAGANVAAASVTDHQVGGTAITDGDGRYLITGVTVGAITVTAARQTSAGHSAGRIDRAGTTARVDITLDGGTVTVSGKVETVAGDGTRTPVPHATVVYRIPPGAPRQPVGFTTTNDKGEYTLAGMPTGEFTVEATVDFYTHGSISSTASAGESLTIDIPIALSAIGTITGTVELPGGTKVSQAWVTAAGRALQTGADGSFRFENIPVGTSIEVNATTLDYLRSASTRVDLTAGLTVNVALVVNGLGTAKFQVIDGSRNPVPNVLVTRMDCSQACGCGGQNTDANGYVTFTNVQVGRLRARAFRIGSTVDTGNGDVSIAREGAIATGQIYLNGFGTVTGTVLDADGVPVFGADVEVSSNHYVNDGILCELTPGVSHRIRTDTQGRFRINNVNIGAVGVRASQAFLPTVVGANDTLVHPGDTVEFTLHLVDTMAGVLSGTIYLPDGVTPAGAGVEVTANGQLPDVTVSTDEAGHYRFAKILPEGTWSLTAADPVTGGRQRQSIFLQRQQNLTYNMRLKGRGAVRVQVVDADNHAVPDAYVRLTETEYPSNSYERGIAPEDNGYAIFPRVFEGWITVEVVDSVGRGGRASTKVEGEGTSIDVKIKVTTTGTVTGHVRMPADRTPVPYAVVNLIAGGRVIGQATTDGGVDVGTFSFDYVPAGPIRLEVLDPATARTGVATGTIIPADTPEGRHIDLDVVLQAIGTVKGTVTGNGPQPGALVTLQSGNFRVDTITDKDGRYLVTGVPEGLVIATAALDSAGFLRGSASASLNGEGTELTLNIALHESGSVAGQLRKFDGSVPPPAALITIASAGGGGVQQVVTREDGTFAFAKVPSGPATVTAAMLNGVDQARQTIDVPANDTVSVAINLNGVGTARITAKDESGAAVVGRVTVSSAPTAPFPYSKTATTNTSGIVEIPDLLAGSVTVRLQVDGAVPLYGTASATIAPTGVTDITVTLQPYGTVTGRVLRPDGTTPAVGADVQVQLLDQPGTFTITADENGQFTAQGVPIGRFALHLHDKFSNGYADVAGLQLTAGGPPLNVDTIVLDDTAVTVTGIDPLAGATNVSVSKTITLTFSDRLRSADGIFARQNGAAVRGQVVRLLGDGQTVTIAPPANGWFDDRFVDVIVPTTIEDIFGRGLTQPFQSQFRTQDLTPPSVSSITPADSTIQVDPATPIVITLSEPIADGHLASVVTVTPVSGASSVAVTGLPTLTAPNVITFAPDAALPGNTRYAITVNHAIDLSGNEQTAAATAFFATPDTIAPVLVLVTPPNGGKTNQAQPAVRIDFTDAASGVDASKLYVSVDGHEYTGTDLTMTATSVTFTTLALVEGPHTVAATIEDRAHNAGALSAAFTVEFDPTASITGHLYQPDGSPAAGLTVELDSVFTVIGTQTTDATGAFRFENLPIGENYTVFGKNAAGRIRARRPGGYIYLNQRGQVVDVPLTLVAEGNITGQVFDPDGHTLASVPVRVTTNHPTLGSAFTWVTTDATGTYRVDGLPVAPVDAYAYANDGAWTGTSTSTIVVDRTIELDIHLAAPTPVYFPVNRYDANNYLFSLERTGITNGNDFALDLVSNGEAMRFEGASQAQLVEIQGDRELVLTQTNLGGLDVMRKVFVPRDGYFARYIERLTNSGAAPVTVDLRITSEANAPSGYHPNVILTSSGDNTLDVGTPATADRWLTIDDDTDSESFGMPALGFLMDGASGASHVGAASLAPGSNARELVYEWQQVTIQPGETVSFLHFGVMQPTRAGSAAAMQRLEQLPPEALNGLEPIDLTSIRNFVLPQDGVSLLEPIGSLTNIVTGHVYAGDGATPVGDAVMTFRSQHPLFGRTQQFRSNSDGTYAIGGYVGDNGTHRPVPHAPFELTARHNDTFRSSPVVPGAFAEGETTATVDVVLTDTGVIAGIAYGLDGQPAPYAAVRAYSNTYSLATHTITDQNGHFALTGLWEATFRVVVSLPHPQGTAIDAEANAAVTANTVTQVDLVPAVGNVTGTILDTNGAPVAGLRLYLGNTSWYPVWNTTTDANGVYTFSNVAIGSFPLNAGTAVQPLTPTVTVQANQTVTQNFTFLGTGTLAITVTNADGTAAAYSSIYLIDQAGAQQYLGYTATNGQLTVSNIRLGSYTVQAFVPNAPSSFFAKSPVTLTQQGQTVPVTVTLPAFGVLTGHLRFPDGSVAYGYASAWPTAAPDQRIYNYTGTDGYIFQKIWADTPLTVEASSGNSVRTVTTSVPAGTTQTLDITLPAQATVQVHVQRGDGTPLQSVQLRLDRPGTQDYATTDGNGDATFWNVPESSFTVRTIHGQGTASGMVAAADHGHTIALTITEAAMSRLTITTITAGDGVTAIPGATFTVNDPDTGGLIANEYFDGGTPMTVNVPASRNLQVTAQAPSQFGYVSSTPKVVMSAAADQTISTSLTLPLAMVTGRVTHSDGSALAAQPTVLLVSIDMSSGSPMPVFVGPYDITPQGEFRILTQYLTDFTVNAMDPDTGLTGSTSGTITDAATPVTADVHLQPSGTVTGTVRDVNGNPVAAATVGIISNGLDLTRQTQSAADGTFTFTRIALGDLTVQAASGTQRASSVGKLASDGQNITVDLAFPPTGTVQGHVTDQYGLAAANRQVVVQSQAQHGPLGAARFETTTDSTGAYQVDGVPVGALWVGAGEQYSSGLSDGLVAGALTTAGGTATVDVAQGNAFNAVGYNLTFRGAFGSQIFDFGCTGDINRGGTDDYGEGSGNPLFNGGGASLRLYGTRFPCASQVFGSQSERRFNFGPYRFGELIATRQTYFAASQLFARYLESITNPTDHPITVDVVVRSRLAGNSRTVTTTPASTSNRYFVLQGGSGFVLAGTTATNAPAEVQVAIGSDVAVSRWPVTIAPGQTIGLLHFFVQSSDAEAARTEADALATLSDPDALTGLTPQQRATVVNFVIP